MDILTALLSGASTVLFWLLPLCAAILTGMLVKVTRRRRSLREKQYWEHIKSAEDAHRAIVYGGPPSGLSAKRKS